jgi:hypothetical protein
MGLDRKKHVKRVQLIIDHLQCLVILTTHVRQTFGISYDLTNKTM